MPAARALRTAVPAALLLVGIAAFPAPAQDPPPARRGHATTLERKVVLLELFTSQG